MPQAHISALGETEQLQKSDNILIIIQRLAYAHKHKAVNVSAAVLFRKVYLHKHFRGSEIPSESRNGGSAEIAAHFAAHLSGYADTVSVLVVHKDRFHVIPVVKLIKIFYRIIRTRFKPFSNI